MEKEGKEKGWANHDRISGDADGDEDEDGDLTELVSDLDGLQSFFRLSVCPSAAESGETGGYAAFTSYSLDNGMYAAESVGTLSFFFKIKAEVVRSCPATLARPSPALYVPLRRKRAVLRKKTMIFFV